MIDPWSILPGDIPDGVIGLADDALNTSHYSSDPLDQTIACARAILAERERCAKIAEDLIVKRRGLSLSFDMIAAAIRKGEA